MAWLDDSIRDHPKMVGLTGEAFRYWVHALCYCSEHGTGGKLDQAIRALRVPPGVVRALVNRGLWEVDEGSYWVHDWAVHNERRDASTDARKAADRERQRLHRDRVKKRKAAEEAKHVTELSRDSDVTASRDSHSDVSRERAGGSPGARGQDHDHVTTPIPNPSHGEGLSEAEEPTNPRTLGTNPRALGTNPRATASDRRARRFGEALTPASQQVWAQLDQPARTAIADTYRTTTGLRFARGTHGSGWKTDPLGTDGPPRGAETNHIPKTHTGKPSQDVFLAAYLDDDETLAQAVPDEEERIRLRDHAADTWRAERQAVQA